MDAETARDLIEAASRHPRTRWCYTLTGPDGQAIAHACARGTHPWTPPPPPPPTAPHPAATGRAATAPYRDDLRLARLAELLAGLNATPEPIARGTCDHAHREDRYIPSRKLKHLIRARTARCCAPGCGAQAITSEIDHTTPLPRRRQLPVQPRPRSANATITPSTHPAGNSSNPSPGVMRWTTPSGRTYTTHPTQYEE